VIFVTDARTWACLSLDHRFAAAHETIAGVHTMSPSAPSDRARPEGSIDFQLTDLDDARHALDELPAGVGRLPQMDPGYWLQRRRKPQAADRALVGATIDWLVSLPQQLRPQALCDQYPRAANAVAEAWNSPQRLAVLDALLSDRRGNRRGFPPQARRELEALREAALSMVAQD
jgi:hypothetical protein